jgi:hypothetical protein
MSFETRKITVSEFTRAGLALFVRHTGLKDAIVDLYGLLETKCISKVDRGLKSVVKDYIVMNRNGPAGGGHLLLRILQSGFEGLAAFDAFS